VVVHACLAPLCFLSHAYYPPSMIPIRFMTLLHLLCVVLHALAILCELLALHGCYPDVEDKGEL